MRVMFVDDEPGVLDGLRNALRRERQNWHMVFTTSGEAALAEFYRDPCDVIISDMRMPHLDGADLLMQVRQSHPAAARIVLSGYAEREVMLRTLPVAHQFLAKPCETVRLRTIIEGICAIREHLPDAALRAAMGAINRLPSSQTAYMAITLAVRDPATSISVAADIVERDAAMSAKTLQLANSSFFGRGRLTCSTREAVIWLGLDLLRHLVLDADVFESALSEVRAGSLPDIINPAELPLAVGRLAMDSCRPGVAVAPALMKAAGTYLMALWGVPCMAGASDAVSRKNAP